MHAPGKIYSISKLIHVFRDAMLSKSFFLTTKQHKYKILCFPYIQYFSLIAGFVFSSSVEIWLWHYWIFPLKGESTGSFKMLVLACKFEEVCMVHTGCVVFLAWVIILNLKHWLAARSLMTNYLINCLRGFFKWHREVVLVFIFVC